MPRIRRGGSQSGLSVLDGSVCQMWKEGNREDKTRHSWKDVGTAGEKGAIGCARVICPGNGDLRNEPAPPRQGREVQGG